MPPDQARRWLALAANGLRQPSLAAICSPNCPSHVRQPDGYGRGGRTRAGHRLGFGYADPVEAAGEILDEGLRPFLDDLQRRAGLGLGSAATEVAAGILLGLYHCQVGGPEALLEYAPDYAAGRASVLVSNCVKLGIDCPPLSSSISCRDGATCCPDPDPGRTQYR
jgi:hypothetical protein